MMVDINNPHDKFFKKALGDPESVKEFFELKLPEKIIKKLKLDSLSKETTSYLDGQMSEFFADLVYTVDLKGEGEGYIVNLFEHKRAVKKDVSFQLLKYMVRIWQKVEENKLPVIIPIIFYHGDNEWTAPVEFKELFAQEDDWPKNVIPNFEYFLSKDEELIEKIPEITTPKFRIALLNLRLSRSRNEKEFIDRFIDLLIELKKYLKKTGDIEYFQINIIYVFYNADPRLIEKEKVIDLTKKYFPERGDHLETLADEFKKEGREEGEKEGIIKTLTKQLENILQKEIPEEIKQKMEEKSRERLIEIGANIMEINSMKNLKNELEE